MVDLIVHDPRASDTASATLRIGGRPSVPAGFAWPHCAKCKGAMRFLGQLPRRNARTGETRLLLLFQCENRPGMCDSWDPDMAANAVLDVGIEGLGLAEVPAKGETLLECLYGGRVAVAEGHDYDGVRGGWAQAQGLGPREVVGQLGGIPSWVQADHTPNCAHCRQPMSFVAQLEQGPDAATEMNFGGGGCAYVFACDCAQGSAKFMWQC